MCLKHNCTTHTLPQPGKTEQLKDRERKTRLVTIISAIAMLLEISFGYITNSMALLSDGWHMCSHVIAIGAGWLVYRYVLWTKASKGSEDTGERLLSLAGYTNALVLFAIAAFTALECLQRLFVSETIDYKEALFVTIIGLLVNLLSVKILHDDHSGADSNFRGAYLHVMSDILTSVLALVVLITGLFYNLPMLDSLTGLVGSAIIIVWAWGLAKDSGKQLLTITGT